MTKRPHWFSITSVSHVSLRCASLLGGMLAIAPANAGTATWLGAPATGNWNTGTNWTAGGPPNGVFDSAFFTNSTQSQISITENTTLDLISINGATAFNYKVTPGNSLTLSGGGVLNFSGLTQTFEVQVSPAGLSAFLNFTDNASAGSLTNYVAKGGFGGGIIRFTDDATASAGVFKVEGGIANGGANGFPTGGLIQFFDSSTAADGDFTVDGGVDAGAQGGTVMFDNDATALNGNFTTNGGNAVGSTGGNVQFVGDSTAADALFINNPGTISGALGGVTRFAEDSTAANGNFTNVGAALAGAEGGFTEFTQNATAGISVLNNNPGTADGGVGGSTRFYADSTAASATIFNNGAIDLGAESGFTLFSQNSTAENAFIKNAAAEAQDSPSGHTTFEGDSTAGFATIDNDGGIALLTGGGYTTFQGNSTAGDANISNIATITGIGLGGATHFRENAGAGAAFLTNFGGAAGGSGFTQFYNASSAEAATIFNASGLLAGDDGGYTDFRGSSSGGAAFITNQGSADVTASAGSTRFYNNSTAGFALIINDAGDFDATPGGVTSFHDNSNAGFSSISNLGAEFTSGLGGSSIFRGHSNAASSEIVNGGGYFTPTSGGLLVFKDASSAGNAFILNDSTDSSDGFGGRTQFLGHATAGRAILSNAGAKAENATGGSTLFKAHSTAGRASIENLAGNGANAAGGQTKFVGNASASNAIIKNSGATLNGAQSGRVTFDEHSSAGNASLIATGGKNGQAGGRIYFAGASNGGTAAVNVSGNGALDISKHLAPGVGTGSIEGNGFVLLGSKQLTVGLNNRSTVFSGVIKDGGIFGGVGGSLRKVGGGTLNLTGTSSYTGNTFVEGGRLLVNGSIASANTFVRPGGLVGGNGFIRGNLINAGVVSPGNSPGTLRVGGNYTQARGGSLVIEVSSVKKYDRLVVGGRASLSGTLQIVAAGKYRPVRGDQLKILTAGGGVSGEFTRVINPYPQRPGSLTYLGVEYTHNAVILATQQNTFENALSIFNLTKNQQATAGALDSALFDARQDKVLDILDAMDITGVPVELDKIAPEELSAAYTVAFSQIDTHAFGLEQRLADIRAGTRWMTPAAPAATSGKAPVADQGFNVLLPQTDRVGFYLTQSGDFTDQSGTPNAEGYESDSSITTLGMDYRLSDSATIGLSLGYAATKGDLNDNGSVEVDGGHAALYGMFQHRSGWFVSGTVGGGYNHYELERSAFEGNAKGDTNGRTFDASATLGVDATWNRFTLTPSASVLYARVNMDGYREAGSLQPLDIASQSADSLRSRLGLRAAFAGRLGAVSLTPYVGAYWQHEFQDDEFAVSSRFANGSGNEFTVYGPRTGRDSVLLNAGINFGWRDYALYLAYQADLGRKNYEEQSVLLGLRFLW